MARLIAVPLISTLIISAMLLVLDRMLRLFDFVATEGGPVSAVWRMLANLLPEYLGLAVPIGLMLGILLAFRRLATSSELDVLRAVGLSYTRLLKVPYMFTIVLAIVNFGIVGFLQPWARYNYEQLRFELRTGALGASIKVGEFTNFGSRMTLRIEGSQQDGRELSGIFVHMVTKDDTWYSVSAQKGTFLRTDNPDEIVFHLTNGTLIQKSRNTPVPRVLTFTTHNLPIPLPKYEAFRTRGARNLELTLPELALLGGNPAAKPELRHTSRAAFHYRMAEVVSMFLLPLLAAALGIPPKRSTSALGVFLSIVMIVTYHKINEYGQALGSLGRIDPIFSLWIPFLAFTALVIWMYRTVAYVPGGQPIGALERVFAKSTALVMRHLPRLLRRRPEANA
ncbi:MAG: LPS export ABC transporter permease LptF [Sphingomonas sp.]